MKYTVEVGSGAMIYILVQRFLKTDSGIKKLIGGIRRHTGSMEIAYTYFRKPY
jgi:hypothetical protein